MGKKKDKKHGAKRGGKHADFPVPPQVMGLAAAVARQVATPAARQMLAGALVAAAGAIAGREVVGAAAAVPPPPVPPIPPTAPEPVAPTFPTPTFQVPPEAAKVIGLATSALERWAQGLVKPKAPQGE